MKKNDLECKYDINRGKMKIACKILIGQEIRSPGRILMKWVIKY